MEIEAVKFLAAAIALIPICFVALALGNIFSSYNNSIGRNPASADYLDKKFFLASAFTEALAIFALLVSLIILFG